LVLACWAAAILMHGRSAPIDYFKAYSSAVTGVSLLLFLWEEFLWPWWIFRPWLTARPDLRGTWKGHFVSDWIDPATKVPAGPTEAYLVIRQTYLTIDVRLLTSESASVTLSANILEDDKKLHTLAVVYRNTPRVLLRPGSPMGHGGMLLSVRGSPAHQLDGEYWTDRRTSGELSFRLRSAKQFHDFQEASKGKYKSSET
jgi:hypothetical protein